MLIGPAVAPIQRRRVQVWYQRSVVVCVWCNDSGPALCPGTSFCPYLTVDPVAHTFGVQLAAKLKLNAPNAHTFLEIIGARFVSFSFHPQYCV